MSTAPAAVASLPSPFRAVAEPSVWISPALHPAVEEMMSRVSNRDAMQRLILLFLPGAGFIGNPARPLSVPLSDADADLLTLFVPFARTPGNDNVTDRRAAFLRAAVAALREWSTLEDCRNALRACVAAGRRSEAEILSSVRDILR